VYPVPPSLFDLFANPLGPASVGLELFLSRPNARAIESTAATMQRFRRGEALFLMPNVFVR